MSIDEGVEQIGILIRQLRRQQNITQTQLGGTRYSKSYVSAVEKNIIRPSSEALRFFAEQLKQPPDYFIRLLMQPESKPSIAMQEEGFLLLRQLLEHPESLPAQAVKALPPLAPELIATLPLSEQAYYYFLAGQKALAKQEYQVALHALEHALPIASAHLQPAVLDMLGQLAYLTRSYNLALHYHQRAFTLLKQMAAQQSEMSLLFTVTLHYSKDYCAMGAYMQANEVYEQAQAHLHSGQDMKSVAQLYMGWGYCTYALSCQKAVQARAVGERLLLEEMQRGFEQAMSLIVQSRNISQISGDHQGEATARLLLAEVACSFSASLRRLAANKGSLFAACLPLLDDAAEQCRLVLGTWQNRLRHEALSQTAIPSIAIASLVAIFIQHAALARLDGHGETALRKRALAAHLCQRALDALNEPVFPEVLLALGVSMVEGHFIVEGTPQSPQLPECINDHPSLQADLPAQFEVYVAAGEVAEELGRVASLADDARACYMRADRCFLAARTCANDMVSAREREPGYVVRCLQRHAYLLEERAAVFPEMRQETGETLLALLKNGLSEMQAAMIAYSIDTMVDE